MPFVEMHGYDVSITKRLVRANDNIFQYRALVYQHGSQVFVERVLYASSEKGVKKLAYEYTKRRQMGISTEELNKQIYTTAEKRYTPKKSERKR
jgi:hypothetical protein